MDTLLQAAESPEKKVAMLTRFMQTTKEPALLSQLYCKRGKIRVTHTNLPKGITDYEECLELLNTFEGDYSQLISETQTALKFARKKYKYTMQLVNNKNETLVTRFTALWKLGEREKAVKLAKQHPTPETFSSMSTMRLIKAGYLCDGAGPLGENKSFKTKKDGPFWWCTELKSQNKFN